MVYKSISFFSSFFVAYHEKNHEIEKNTPIKKKVPEKGIKNKK